MTTAARPRLKVLPGGASRRPPARCDLAAQAVMAGPQDMRVTAMSAKAAGRGWGHICIRVGRCLIYLEDRDALEAWIAAIQQAIDLQDGAFGSDEPQRYELKRSGR